MRAILREPLLHFLVLGALLFGAQYLLHGGEQSRRIVVTPEIRRELVQNFTRANGHAPSAEREAELVSQWIDQEVLYRAGKKRKLDKDDPRIRSRVADKMGFVLESKLTHAEPSEAELEKWFSAHRDKWKKAAQVDFIQVFVTGNDAAARTRAEALLSQLRQGAEPAGLGDRFSGGRHYRRRSLESLRQAFGDRFVTGLDEQPVGSWALHESRFGLHLVRVERRTAATAPNLESVKADVLEDWKRARRSRALAKEIAELRSHYQIIQEP